MIVITGVGGLCAAFFWATEMSDDPSAPFYVVLNVIGSVFCFAYAYRTATVAKVNWNELGIQKHDALHKTPFFNWRDLSGVRERAYYTGKILEFGPHGSLTLPYRLGLMRYAEYREIIEFAENVLKENARTS